jgi:ribosomal protein S18 acetylase RimI-like enzyme
MQFVINKSSEKEIHEHLVKISPFFKPQLNSYVDLKIYSNKIFNKSVRFDCFNENNLIGLIALYISEGFGFITNISVLPQFQGQGIAQNLLINCVCFVKKIEGIKYLRLEVFHQNKVAQSFYGKNNFKIISKSKKKVIMELNLFKDFNAQIQDTADHKYAYYFDTEIMQYYMLKSFKTFFNKGNLLELGSFKGAFTKRFLPYFEYITCVEASDEALKVAEKELRNRVIFFNSMFEMVSLPTKYDNIIMTHVLEHLDDPVAVLKRVNDEWLSDTGRFFLVCPNANAPSRQIAVKMGLISHNAAVTPAEKEHGHTITYTLDTLERDAKAAGLNVIHRSGIFFKALANFQWDRLLQTDIISKEYLDGCYELGHHYPDLCSSIFLLCEKGK